MMLMKMMMMMYLSLGSSQVSSGSLGGGHDFIEFGLVPSIGVLKDGNVDMEL